MLFVVLAAALLALAPAAAAATAPGYTQSVVADNTGNSNPRLALSGGLVDVATDSQGNTYVSDAGQHVVFRVAPDGTRSIFAGTGGASTTPVDGRALSVALGEPYGLAVDAADTVYITDRTQHRVVQVTSDGNLTTVMGDGTSSKDAGGVLVGPRSGPALQSPLNPIEVAVGADGTVYAVDEDASAVVAVRGGTLSVVAGTAAVNAALGVTGPALFGPKGLVVRDDGTILVSNKANHDVVSIRDRAITEVAGGRVGPVRPGPATSSGLSYPERIALDPQGNLYIADAGNDSVDVVDSDGTISALPVTLDEPTGVSVTADGSVLIVDQRNRRVLRWAPDERPVVLGPSSLTADVGDATRGTLTGTSVRTWSLVGPVPAGALLSGSTLSWTPPGAGTSSVTVQACAWLMRSCTRTDVVLVGRAVLPGAPSDLAAVQVGGDIHLTWTAPTSSGGTTLDGYTVTAEDDTGRRTALDVTGTSARLHGLDPGVLYTVRVAARNSAGTGTPSTPVPVQLPAPAPVPTPTTASPTATPTPPATQQPSATPKPSATTTDEPTADPDPTATSTATPTPEPSAGPTSTPTAPVAAPPPQTSAPTPTRSRAIAIPSAPGGGRREVGPVLTSTAPSGRTTAAAAPGPATPVPVTASTAPAPSGTPTGVPGEVPGAGSDLATAAAPAPRTHDVPLLQRLPEALAAPARVVATVGVAVVRHAEYPSAVFAAAGVFLLAQRRIDRDDPKLALAPVVPDDLVPFEPAPPTPEAPRC